MVNRIKFYDLDNKNQLTIVQTIVSCKSGRTHEILTCLESINLNITNQASSQNWFGLNQNIFLPLV